MVVAVAAEANSVERFVRERAAALCTRGRKLVLVCRKTSASSHIEYKKGILLEEGNPSCTLNRQ